MDTGGSGQRFRVVWRDVSAEEPHDDALAAGGARFQRLEGCHFAGGGFWFDDTSGGAKRHGQLYRLVPSGDPRGHGADTLELLMEGDSTEQTDSPDNICVTPWGDLWFAEDGDGVQRVMGDTPGGGVYEFARRRQRVLRSDVSPDGRTFFLNIQSPGHTLAIWGRFPRSNPGRSRELAGARPRHRWAPKVSDAGREHAQRHGISPYEAAAFERLGAALA